LSFYPTKNLGAMGDAGAVVTNDASLADRLRRLRNGGQTSRYHHDEFGVNSRLDEMQAAVLRARLPFLLDWTARRRAIAARYRAALRHTALHVPPERDAGHVYHLFPALTEHRTAFQAHLQSRKIGTLVHYPVALPQQPAFAAYDPAACPIGDRIARTVCSLPLHPRLTDADIDAVIDAANGWEG
jgi:dTDP-4-amino-4,6-dideoxygalactose transaminase